MGSVVKKSVSFREDLWRGLEEMVEEDHTNVSAVVNEALEHILGLRAGRRAIDQWEAEHGAFTPAELAEADAILDAAGVGRPARA